VAPAVVTRVALDRRERAVSRDSQREAVANAKDRRLQVATEKAAKKRRAALAALTASAHREVARVARAAARRAAQRAALNAWHLPVTPGAYHLTSRFGDCSSLWSHCHTGLDFAAPTGTPIRAVATGTITETSWAGAYGNRTIMRIAGGTELWYCHQSSQSVRPGQRVVTGQVIGAVGSTGNTTGPHVHLEVRPEASGTGADEAAAVPADTEGSADASAGDPVDPFTALVEHGLKP